MTVDVRETAVPAQRGAHHALVPSLPVRRLPRWQRAHLATLVLLDVVAVSGAWALAISLRFRFEPATVMGASYWALLPAVAAAWVLVAGLSGAYEPRASGAGSEEYKRVLNATIRFAALVAVSSYALQAEPARALVLTALPTTAVTVLAGRHVARLGLQAARRRGLAVRRVLVVGTHEAAFSMAARLASAQGEGYRVVGVCAPGGIDRRVGRGPAPDGDRRRGLSLRVLGALGEIPRIARRDGIDVVAVASSPAMTPEVLRALAWELEETDVDMLVAPALVDVAGPRIHVSPVARLPLLHVEKPEFSGVRRLLKSTYDRGLALTGLLLLVPVFAVIALLVRLDSPGPVFFRQTRVGQGGREFTMLKFRSMFVDAEERLKDIAHANAHGEGPLFKMKDDPRLTRVGARLRRWSLDELPQLINVLRGDMSLVGPRPPLPREVAKYERPSVFRRLMVKPGLTGLWQVSGRADLAWQESVRLDLYYVENWSPALDLWILWRTAGAVVRGSGAY
ncbi:sugar transferase [Motilibacter deserti]|uniref:Sugar transferase n=1 Tax=Motilibacter deserti TaxID=2714956 RepID=A0ABX0H3F3_9ACTN|nr:sugar transferase [Motilibacter deserti]NHC16319.1 sugar transferase [Motilibacter deserti]